MQEMRWGFDSWVWKILWRSKWQHTPIFLPGKSHGQRSLVGRSIGSQRVGHDRGTKHAKPYSRVKPKFGETKHEIYEKDVFFRQFIYS